MKKISILQQYMKNGLIDYSRLKNDSWLRKNIEKIANTDLISFNYKEEFAFWLNAYNLLTLNSVIIELEKNTQWKGNTSIYAKLKFYLFRRHKVARRKVSLYNLENKILRKKFRDPRIHFAINCGSKSCPFLPNKLFQADYLDEYLDELSSQFINDQGGVTVSGNNIYVSPIFKWYKKDFDYIGGILPFINKYWKNDASLPQNPKIKYFEYNWEVNSMY